MKRLTMKEQEQVKYRLMGTRTALKIALRMFTEKDKNATMRDCIESLTETIQMINEGQDEEI